MIKLKNIGKSVCVISLLDQRTFYLEPQQETELIDEKLIPELVKKMILRGSIRLIKEPVKKQAPEIKQNVEPEKKEDKQQSDKGKK